MEIINIIFFAPQQLLDSVLKGNVDLGRAVNSYSLFVFKGLVCRDIICMFKVHLSVNISGYLGAAQILNVIYFLN